MEVPIVYINPGVVDRLLKLMGGVEVDPIPRADRLVIRDRDGSIVMESVAEVVSITSFDEYTSFVVSHSPERVVSGGEAYWLELWAGDIWLIKEEGLGASVEEFVNSDIELYIVHHFGDAPISTPFIALVAYIAMYGLDGDEPLVPSVVETNLGRCRDADIMAVYNLATGSLDVVVECPNRLIEYMVIRSQSGIPLFVVPREALDYTPTGMGIGFTLGATG